MRDVLKFLLVLSTVHLVSSAVTYRKGLAAAEKKVTCPEGQYNYKDLGFCFKCTQCAEFLYVKEKCSEFSNTVCGWCGKEPNYSEISDEVLASYQNKCLMSRLDFVDMSQLEKELLEEEEANVDSGSVEDDEPYFGWAVEEDVSDEMEGRVPRYEDSKEQAASSESESSSEPEEDEQEARGEEKMEDSEEEDDNEIDKSVSEHVNAYLLEKNEKSETSENRNSKNPFIKDGVTILSRDEVEASLKHLVELIPVQRIYDPAEMVDSSSEDSNERDIKWDRWVDDEVKPIREYVRRDGSDVIEAEEFNDDTIKVYSLNLNERDFVREGEEAPPAISDRLRAAELIRYLIRIAIFFVGMAIVFKILMMARAMRAERRQFHGVPVDCQDYHMIIDGSRYVEEMEKKEQKAARHIHENPAFDI